MATLFAEHFQALDSSGDPLSGALLYFYQTGTTTEITTYTDAAETTPHANPVVADSSGRFAPIYVTSFGFKTVLKTSAEVTVQTVDPVDPSGFLLVQDTSPQLGGELDGQGEDITGIGVLTMVEQAAAEADVAGNGQFWVKTATPNEPYFTNDAGTDQEIAVLDGLLQDLDTLGAPSTDGEVAVATGAGALAWESGATLRTSVGVGTGDSPQFTGIELGHASDTTLARSSAGVMSVEGAVVRLAGSREKWVDAEDWKPTITNGVQAYLAEEGTNDVMTYGLAFDQTTEEYATWSYVFPSSWNGGTVTFTPHWTTNAGGSSETVDWSFAGVSIGNDDTLDAAPGTAVTSTDTWSEDVDVHIGPATAAITITAAAAGERVTFKVYRDVSEDDLGGDAIFLGALLTFTINAATG